MVVTGSLATAVIVLKGIAVGGERGESPMPCERMIPSIAELLAKAACPSPMRDD